MMLVVDLMLTLSITTFFLSIMEVMVRVIWTLL